MGVHSTFFGPIKYAILPQHLHDEEVLGGTGLVEAGTYIAILAGTILAGVIPVQAAAVCIILTAVVGWLAGRNVPAAPSLLERQPIDFHIIRSSIALVRGTMHLRRLYLVIFIAANGNTDGFPVSTWVFSWKDGGMRGRKEDVK